MTTRGRGPLIRRQRTQGQPAVRQLAVSCCKQDQVQAGEESAQAPESLVGLVRPKPCTSPQEKPHGEDGGFP